uniref:Sphingomyelin phosphodiesterase 4-like n=1 Tax=Phallusia mammillata TaxID=59560 RepID=A0A6F9DTV5_9ASCI|nr:sphingomyelin phosphodiesterase 4-like [Phallusia mammillata]
MFQSVENGNGFGQALQKPNLVDKCSELTKLIEKHNVKTLHQYFSSIVHQIFAVSCPGWNLQQINPRIRPTEFNCVKEFLGRQGAMLRMVHKLQSDANGPCYEFPISMLPPSYHQNADPSMQTGQRMNTLLGPWPVTVGSMMFKGQTCIKLSAFEFYFYHFARYIINPPVQIASHQPFLGNVQNTTNDDNAYGTLLDDYMSYFLPLDGPCPPALQLSTSTESTVRSSPWLSPVSGMLRKSPVKSSNTLGVTQNEIWRSDILVSILVEFWLGLSIVKGSQKLPSEEVVGSIRRLVKHVHHFSNANTFSLSYSNINDSVMEQFKLRITSNCLQPKLFDFLVYCFEVWPLSASFRIVLETWLSYIQPWRYTDTSAPFNNADMRLSSSREIANAWYGFISRNLRFYTKLFADVLARFLRTDLSNHANSLLLYRVAKIFSQPNLMQMIEEAEGEIDKSFKYMPGSYIASPGISNIRTQAFFSDELSNLCKQLLVVCQQALATLRKNMDKGNTDFSSKVLMWIGLDSLAEVSGLSGQEGAMKKCVQQLQDAMKMLSDLFELPIPELDDSMSSSVDDKSNPLGPDAADCVVDDNGQVQLTDLGKYQLMNNIRKLPVHPKCDPELQPIRSYENAMLVRSLYKISTALTKKYSKQIDTLCQRHDFVGKFCRFYLLPYSDSKSPAVKKQFDKPRISLRFLAHYRTLVYLFVGFAILNLLGYGCISSLLYFVSFVILYCIVRVLIHE